MTNAIVPNLTELLPERSTQIAAIGYDANILFVQFRRGGLYTYDKVTQAEYDALLAAPSIGSTFAKTIKGVKPYKQIAGKAASEPKQAAAPAKTSNVVPFTRGAATVTTDLITTSPALPAKTGKETDDLASAATQWAMRATAIQITDVATHEEAQKTLLEIDTVRKRVIATWKPMKEAAFKAHRAVCDKEAELLKPLTDADRLLRQRIGEYAYAQVKAAQEEDDRKRREAEAEAHARAIAETEETALAAAEELMAMGDREGAEAVLENPMPAPIRYEMPAPVKPAVASVAGVSGALAYEVTITNLAEVPREYLVIDLDKTRTEIARRVKQAAGRLQVPGVTIRETFATRRVGGRR